MYQMIEARKNEYRSRHPATSEMDLQICKMFCNGKNVVQISMTVPCSESTVYRAINRIREFIRLTNANRFIEAIRECVDQYDPNFGDGNASSALEMLYAAYLEYNNLEGDDVRAGFAKLDEVLSGFPLSTVDSIIDEVCALCHYHERAGFTEGLKLGVKLGEELSA